MKLRLNVEKVNMSLYIKLLSFSFCSMKIASLTMHLTINVSYASE